MNTNPLSETLMADVITEDGEAVLTLKGDDVRKVVLAVKASEDAEVVIRSIKDHLITTAKMLNLYASKL